MTDRGRRTEPVFIGGADRSGTTLAFALLASHPNISMVRRTNMWRWFDGRFGDLAEPANLEAAIDALRRYRRLDQLDPDWDRVRRDVTAGPPTYARLFDSMHRQRAERLGRARWGDKSLHTECYADAVFRAYDLPRYSDHRLRIGPAWPFRRWEWFW